MDFTMKSFEYYDINSTFDPFYVYDYNWSWWGDYSGSGRPPRPSNPPPDSQTLDHAQINTIYFVLVGIILPIGFFFNVLSIVVFATSRSLRKTTTGHYLLALSIADVMFLAGEMLKWMNTENLEHLGVHISFIDTVDPLCKMVYCLRYGAKLASAWIIVMITAERFITVVFPLRISRVSTPRIAKITISITFILSFLAGSFPMWTVTSYVFDDVPICGVPLSQLDLYNMLNWVFLRGASLLIPWILIVVFCILIVIFLTKARNIRQRTLSINRCNSQQSRTGPHNLEKQLTTMLLAVALAFVLLRLPYTIAFYLLSNKHRFYSKEELAYIDAHLLYANKMTDIFVSVNYAINFFLYCVCGSSFRRQLVNLFHCRYGRRWSSQRSHNGSSLSRNGPPRVGGPRVELTRNERQYIRGISRQDSRMTSAFSGVP